MKELDNKIFCIGNELRVSSILEWMGCILYNIDAFITLPGGLETLDEISSIAYQDELNFHQKPLELLNFNDFYNGLLLFLNHTMKYGFIPRVARRAIMFVLTTNKLIDQL